MAIGVLTGVLEFVPVIGPLLAAIPAVLLGLTVSPMTAVWVGVSYAVIFQIEGNLITPLVQKQAVELPPVLTLLSIIAFGTLFGPLGTIVGVPIAVLGMVATRHFYIRGALHEDPESETAAS